MRAQVQDALNDPEALIKKPVPKGGWLKLIRQALGMSGQQLANILKCSQSNVTAIERREAEGTLSLDKLENTAKALHCRLVYFLIPEKPLEKLREDRARLIAKKRLKSIGHSMELELQGLSPSQQKKQEEDLVQELLEENAKHLWDLIDEI